MTVIKYSILTTLIVIISFMVGSHFIILDKPVIISSKYSDAILDLYNFRGMTVNASIIIIDTDLDGRMRDATLIHEMTHINQVKEIGYLRFTFDSWYSKLKHRSMTDHNSWYEQEAYHNKYEFLFSNKIHDGGK